jgi:RNA polymerase-associated protein
MATITNKKSVITLYSNGSDIYDHRVRLALAEKAVMYEVVMLDSQEQLNHFAAVNPYGELPTLVDRDLVVYEPNIILEYLDERFPHPPLLPVYPVMRTRLRLIVHRLDLELAPLIAKMAHATKSKSHDAKLIGREICDYFLRLLPLLANTKYFVSDEFTIVDCCLAPILWRFPQWQISLGKEMKALKRYADDLFARNSFQNSLNDQEREMCDNELVTS